MPPVIQLLLHGTTVPGSHRSRAEPSLATGAYWTMIRRLVLISGTASALWTILFGILNAPLASTVGLISLALYALVYLLLQYKRNTAAMFLIWIEVLGHTAMACLLLGWDSAFHLHLLLCIPAAVVASRKRNALTMVVALFTFYLALDAACTLVPPLSPLPMAQLQIVKWINFSLVFGVFFAMASLYRSTVLQSEQGLMAQATTDALTGLLNRQHFRKRADIELARSHRNQEPVSLVMADIDFFKQVNDQYGHPVGDRVLIQVAQILQQFMREVDVVARWGGEEFLMLLPNSDTPAALAVTERIRLALECTPYMNMNTPLVVTMSFGITRVADPSDLDAATSRADSALYRSKECGRNQIRLG